MFVFMGGYCGWSCCLLCAHCSCGHSLPFVFMGGCWLLLEVIIVGGHYHLLLLCIVGG